MGGNQEAGNHFGNSGGGVNEKIIKLAVESLHLIQQNALLPGIQPGNFLDAGRSGNHLNAPGAIDDDVNQALLAGKNMGKIVLGRKPQQDIEIGQSQVRVKNHHPAAGSRQHAGQVGNHIGLAHPSLAAGNRNHPGFPFISF